MRIDNFPRLLWKDSLRFTDSGLRAWRVTCIGIRLLNVDIRFINETQMLTDSRPEWERRMGTQNGNAVQYEPLADSIDFYHASTA